MQPDYYKGTGDSGFQVFDAIEKLGLGFHEGNVLKYITRWKEKGGVSDLEKAKDYIDRLIKNARQPSKIGDCFLDGVYIGNYFDTQHPMSKPKEEEKSRWLKLVEFIESTFGVCSWIDKWGGKCGREDMIAFIENKGREWYGSNNGILSTDQSHSYGKIKYFIEYNLGITLYLNTTRDVITQLCEEHEQSKLIK